MLDALSMVQEVTVIEPVSTIVTNSVNDAVRHGGAEHIGVSLNREGGELVLRVTNDGSEMSGSGSAEGLGHATLERLAPSAWKRNMRAGVTVLAVRFPARPSSASAPTAKVEA